MFQSCLLYVDFVIGKATSSVVGWQSCCPAAWSFLY